MQLVVAASLGGARPRRRRRPEELGDASVLGTRAGRCARRRRAARRPLCAATRPASSPADAAHDLADQKAERVDVVAVRARRAPTTAPGARARRSCAASRASRRRAAARATAGSPARCESTWRRVIASLPAARELRPQRAMGASRSTRPRSTSGSAQTVLSALLTEKTSTSVSRRHGRVRAASAQPPQRSTTIRPSSAIATAAPTSPRSVKFVAKASRTAAKRAIAPAVDDTGASCPRPSPCRRGGGTRGARRLDVVSSRKSRPRTIIAK